MSLRAKVVKVKNSINENGQCAGNGNGKGDGDGNNGAAHELKRKSLLNQRQGRARERRGEGVGEKSCSGAALANRKSALPKICAEWQLRVLQVERGRLREGERSEEETKAQEEAELPFSVQRRPPNGNTRHTTRRIWLEMPATLEAETQAQEKAEMQ